MSGVCNCNLRLSQLLPDARPTSLNVNHFRNILINVITFMELVCVLEKLPNVGEGASVRALVRMVWDTFFPCSNRLGTFQKSSSLSSSMIYKIFSIGIKYNINIIKNAIFDDDVLPSLNVKHFRSTLIASGPTQNS